MTQNDATEEQLQRAKQLAEDHWNYLSLRIGELYKDAFVHGYKHRIEDEKDGN